MHKPRIGFPPARWLFVKMAPSPACERRQVHTVPTGDFGCQEAGCQALAQPVYEEEGGAIVGWLCVEHAVSAGYCNHCGVYIDDDPAEQATWAFYGRCQACTELLFQ